MANRNNPYTSDFLGLFEGRRKVAIEQAKDATMALEADLKLKTAAVDAAKTQAQLELEKIKNAASTNMYLILGVVLVLVVGIAVYFKFRKK
jgi:LPXTG-motif cell wall-anchored protein